MILNYAKSRMTLMLGGSSVVSGATYFELGIGSSTVTTSDTTLLTGSIRQLITSATFPSSYKVTYQGDWNSVLMSGIQLKEFGVTGSATGITGSMWSRNVIPSLTFDGTNELQIQETWEVF